MKVACSQQQRKQQTDSEMGDQAKTVMEAEIRLKIPGSLGANSCKHFNSCGVHHCVTQL